ncbi:MAG: tautomerase family protein [Clostridia bacterium]|nr:tautomerase family protein [Clostridia bacterium]MBQ9925525.1 tautomerase family protein [Clostridia bacterium]
MPHIAVIMLPGKDEATKKDLAQKLQDLFVAETNLPRAAVTVSMNEVVKENLPTVMSKIPAENRIEL